MPPVTLRASGPDSLLAALRLAHQRALRDPDIDLARLGPACAGNAQRASQAPRLRRAPAAAWCRRRRAAASIGARRCARPRSTRAMSAGWPASSAKSLAASVAAPSPATRGSDGIASFGNGGEDAARLVDQEIAVAEAPDGERRSLADAHLEPVRKHALDARPLHPGQALDAVLGGAAVEAQHACAPSPGRRHRRCRCRACSGAPSRDTWVRPKPASSMMRSISASAGAGEFSGLANPANTRKAMTPTAARASICNWSLSLRPRRRRAGRGAREVAGLAALRTGRGAGDWLARLQMSARSLPVATRLLDHPAHELGKRQSGVRRQLRNERGRRHAGLRIHFQADQLARAAGGVVVAEVRPRNAAAAQCFMSRQR